MQEVTDLLDSDILYLVRPTEPERPDRGKFIKWQNLKAITGTGGGEPGEPATTWTPRWDLFRGDGVTTRFQLSHDVAGPNECAINARALVYDADYYFDFNTNELVFYEAPEDPGTGIDDNVAISYYQDVGGIAFLKENQGLESVLGVDNEATLDIITGGGIYAGYLFAPDIQIPAFAQAAESFIVGNSGGLMRRLNIGTGFEVDYQNNVINVIGGGGGSSDGYLSSFAWNAQNKQLSGNLSGGGTVPAITLSGLAALADLPTDFVKASTGGKFFGRVEFDNSIRLTGVTNRIYGPSLSTYINLTNESFSVYTEGNARLISNRFGLDVFGDRLTIASEEILWAGAGDTSGGKMLVINNSKQFELQPIPQSAGQYVLPPATNTEIGGVKPGAGLSVLPDGTIYFTGSGGDGNNYPTSVSVNASGVLSIARAGLSVITTNLYTRLDDRYVKTSDYSGGGGGVSGLAGTIPVFDASSDGVGNSKLKEVGSDMIADGYGAFKVKPATQNNDSSIGLIVRRNVAGKIQTGIQIDNPAATLHLMGTIRMDSESSSPAIVRMQDMSGHASIVTYNGGCQIYYEAGQLKVRKHNGSTVVIA